MAHSYSFWTTWSPVWGMFKPSTSTMLTENYHDFLILNLSLMPQKCYDNPCGPVLWLPKILFFFLNMYNIITCHAFRGNTYIFTHFCFSETQKAKVNMFLLIDWWEIFNKLINSRYTSTLFRFNNLGIYNSENQRMKRLQSSQENAFIKWIHYIFSMLRFILRDELVSNHLFLSKFCSIFMINSIVWLNWWNNSNNNN